MSDSGAIKNRRVYWDWYHFILNTVALMYVHILHGKTIVHRKTKISPFHTKVYRKRHNYNSTNSSTLFWNKDTHDMHSEHWNMQLAQQAAFQFDEPCQHLLRWSEKKGITLNNLQPVRWKGDHGRGIQEIIW